jgi:hypothetical protein
MGRLLVLPTARDRSGLLGTKGIREWLGEMAGTYAAFGSVVDPHREGLYRDGSQSGDKRYNSDRLHSGLCVVLITENVVRLQSKVQP